MKINMNDLRIILHQAERQLRIDENFLKSEIKKGKSVDDDKLLKNVNQNIEKVKPIIERINNILIDYEIDIEREEN